MNLSLRFVLAYFILVGVTFWSGMQSFTNELVPVMRQSLEEALVDTANLLSEIVRDELSKGEIQHGNFAKHMESFSQRKFSAVIWTLKKQNPSINVYITDALGKVIYDSRGKDLGQDYSRWNDVYLTLQGKYGARTTRENPNDELSSIMYIAAPIYNNDKIIGVLTVSKPSITIQPFIDATLSNIQSKGIWILLVSMAVGLLLIYWLTYSIRHLTRYAQQVSAGERVEKPILRERELAQLADSIENMRVELEGKHYVEKYLHTLTHELKSPLAAIKGAAELLGEPMPIEHQKQFLNNIQNQSERLEQVIEYLLNLAALEKQQSLLQIESVCLYDLVDSLINEKIPLITFNNLTIINEIDSNLVIEGEHFLLQQAINNLLDNAIQFSPSEGVIVFNAKLNETNCELSIRDHGPGIPDYALERIFERFYSLQRPDGSPKSSGLGLSFVQEVIQLHHGTINISNHSNEGVIVTIQLPNTQKD
ncbi:MAG: two-component system sensor histidine kinase CreC [Gammaproteobacteria bacterium]|jgi:two-component system sensor histidine kinase CreC|nr:two-component system sensor histidine kinase CreC [Gammaproteobacteria bacterium]MBT3725589.1 two-component system sensor histidine kinase CreC [Gammaproteobacteria bacterium]MBT4194352.1 two-component system sensor histidine kinase CreC [Gammaproteobacteria bacterium]MBT4451980.1 two-component system sensor histidine kinase CreC [Gammaproteobacteria bacterium]MBT4860698.1 two-component system sensor histidine kinase CreC [Gammaproteobacteria bacterium]